LRAPPPPTPRPSPPPYTTLFRSQLAQDTGGDTARRLGEDALGPRQEVDGVDDFVVAHVFDGASGALCDVEHVGTVGRVADRQGLGDGVGFDRLYGVVPVLPRLGDRGAARGLGTEDLVRTVLDQSGVDELLEALVDLGEL